MSILNCFPSILVSILNCFPSILVNILKVHILSRRCPNSFSSHYVRAVKNKLSPPPPPPPPPPPHTRTHARDVLMLRLSLPLPERQTAVLSSSREGASMAALCGGCPTAGCSPGGSVTDPGPQASLGRYGIRPSQIVHQLHVYVYTLCTSH